MSLESSTPRTKRRKAIYGIAALCLALLVGFAILPQLAPSFAEGADEKTENLPASPIPLPTTIPIPVSSPGPVSSPSPNPLPTGTPTLVRDLNLYENAGTINLGTSDASAQAAIAQTRAFILRKWNARQLGRLAFVTKSPTNQPFTRNFYIERNTAGVWQVTLEVAEAEPQEFTFVEEIGVSADGHPILEPSRPGSPAAVTRALHLKVSSSVKNGLVL